MGRLSHRHRNPDEPEPEPVMPVEEDEKDDNPPADNPSEAGPVFPWVEAIETAPPSKPAHMCTPTRAGANASRE